MSKDTFCVLPWMHLATNAGGNFRVCCNSSPGKNLILREDGNAHKLYRDDLNAVWNSETYKTIRKQMLEGERPDMCVRCFREEDAGLNSARTSANNKWKDDATDYVENPALDVRYIDLRLGNLCNLRCRMCNPYASNQWLKEWDLIAPGMAPSERDRLKKMDWPEQPKTWENLFSISDTIEEIYLTGGEPTIIKEQHQLLDYFIDNSTAKNIKLKYNINMTNIPKHLLNKWRHFKRVQLNCSIDAVGDLNRYIRYPSNWSTITKTWEQIHELDNVDYEIHCTVQMYNILKLNELIDWASAYDTRIYFNILNHPQELNIRVLPAELKALAAERLQPYLHIEKVSGVIDYMYAEDWSTEYDKFLAYTDALDISRGENLFDIVKEFRLE
jgi:sulfatase maturation enzyme AslB (radical SAM superfamily)